MNEWQPIETAPKDKRILIPYEYNIAHKGIDIKVMDICLDPMSCSDVDRFIAQHSDFVLRDSPKPKWWGPLPLSNNENWRPIQTLPINRKAVLLFGKFERTIPVPVVFVGYATSFNLCKIFGCFNQYRGYDGPNTISYEWHGNIIEAPFLTTKWMPLPAPPNMEGVVA